MCEIVCLIDHCISEMILCVISVALSFLSTDQGNAWVIDDDVIPVVTFTTLNKQVTITHGLITTHQPCQLENYSCCQAFLLQYSPYVRLRYSLKGNRPNQTV